ncbi:MAG: aspartate kinase [Cytophagales bacterium]|nr:MAG: aspartate kinase [Cytophagales bacterium]
MLTVEKIGGTSMSAFGDVLNNIITYKRTGKELYNRIFIVSAYSGVTNWLLENKKTGDPGIYHHFINQNDFHKSLSDLIIKLKEINKSYVEIGLDLKLADAFIESRINDAEKYLSSLADVLASGYVSQENIFQAAREILASIGESHSAYNSVNILKNKGINSILVDLSGFHDSEPLTIDQRVHQSLRNIDFSNNVTFVTGYTKGTEGIMREFDRGYSEVTFSKVAVAVRADEAIIHKEYHLSSADPNIVGIENCVPVGYTNYDVADQLADVGMEAIHPKAAKPLEINKINLRIMNTFEPDHPGTLITKNYVGMKKRVEVITGSDKVLIIDIHDPLMVGAVGYDLKIMEDFASFNISYICKATSANSISLVIWEKDYKQELIKLLESKYQTIIVKKVAIVCLIGTNIDQPGVLGKAAVSLGENSINILAISHSLRQVNIQFVIEREKFKDAIKVLNANIYFN